MSAAIIQQARETYNISHWSDGYFDITEQGHVIAYPDGDHNKPGVNLVSLAQKIAAIGLSPPVLIRFTDILRHRLAGLKKAFSNAIREYDYSGNYCSVYPIKVNQQRKVVEELLQHGGTGVGLEAGSKPELLAVIALSAHPESVVICNGYKDREYIRIALIGQQLGHRVYIIIEKLSELDLILEEAAKLGVSPRVGIRVRLASIGAGNWQNTGGEKSKFGLSADQVLTVIERLRQNKQLEILQLLHCHLGSQIANIRDIQQGLREVARYFAELRLAGANISYVDVGGGLGVDYEGTRSRSFCSMNYSMQEYANNVVHILKDICQEQNLPHPGIITESGRALTAHHAMLILNVIDIERKDQQKKPTAMSTSNPILQGLWHTWQNIEARSPLEIYHDAYHLLSEAQSMFAHGTLNLKERAQAEQLYLSICLKIRELLQPNHRPHRELLDELNEKLADKIFANFSVFQSVPDVWALDQIFPIMPLQGLDQPLSRRAVLQDMTCDSDGRIDHYVDGQGIHTTLPLPEYQTNQTYWLGIFLVGAYQEILGDMHNLFGDTNALQLELKPEGGYQILEPTHGDTVADVLRYVHFAPEALLASYEKQLAKSDLSTKQKQGYLEELQAGLSGYTYLED